jgi:hypothetical protein
VIGVKLTESCPGVPPPLRDPRDTGISWRDPNGKDFHGLAVAVLPGNLRRGSEHGYPLVG